MCFIHKHCCNIDTLVQYNYATEILNASQNLSMLIEINIKYPPMCTYHGKVYVRSLHKKHNHCGKPNDWTKMEFEAKHFKKLSLHQEAH